MDVDKGFIERSNFSTSRRGYDPDEVDKHLKEITARVDEMRREQSSAKLAGAAAEQVRIIVEAAERSASEIEEKAELEGKRRIQDAERRAEDAAKRADAAADQQIARVEEATARMLERADVLESDVTRLLGDLRQQAEQIVDALRTGAGRVDEEVDQIRSGMSHIQTARAEEIAPAAEAEAEAGPADAEPSVVEGVTETIDEEIPVAAEPAAEDTGVGEPEPLEEVEEEPATPTGRFQRGGSGAEGARLVALNMALNGTPRAETARYLSENFEIDDQDSLLDDVYAQVGGPA